MAQLKDLTQFAEELLPLVKGLVARASTDANEPDTAAQVRPAIEKLRKLVNEAGNVTEAPVEARVAAIVAARGVLTEVLVSAAASQAQLSEIQVREIQAIRNTLRDEFGRLLEIESLPISRLLDDGEVARISEHLRQAVHEIEQRQRAKQILDVIVETAIIAGRIASKLVV